MKNSNRIFAIGIIFSAMIVQGCKVHKQRESSLKDNITLESIDSFVFKHLKKLDSNRLKTSYGELKITAKSDDSIGILSNGIRTIYKDSFFIRIEPSINGRRYKYFDYSGRIFKIEYYFPSGWLDKRYIVKDGYYYKDASVPMGHEF